MKTKFNKKLSAAIVMIAVAVLFASSFAITSFTDKAKVNNLAQDSSTYVAGLSQGQQVQALRAEYVNDGQSQAETIMANLGQNIDQYAVKAKQQDANVKGSSEGTSLPAAVQNTVQPANLNSYEQQVLDSINNIRAANGLGPLAASQTLTNIARSRSADMLSRGYFSHYTPEGLNIFNILKSNGISYRNAGENLAHSQPASAGTPQAFADAWMNSPTHRANILRGEYGQIGIGLAENGGRRVVTTVFMN